MAIITLRGAAGPVVPADRAREPVLGAVTLDVDGGTQTRAEGAAHFEILVDGAPVKIDASGVAPELLSLEERSTKGAWTEVEADPLAGPFLDKAPGPHVFVKLEGAALLPGEVAHVLGEVTATEPVPDTGAMRTPPTYRPSEVRAIAVAAGPGAESFIALARTERAPAAARPASSSEPVSWKTWVLVALFLAVAALLVSALVASPAARVELWMLVLTAGAFVARFRLDPPPFRGREVQPALGWWDLYYLIAFLGFAISALVFLVTAVSALRGDGEPARFAPMMVPLLGAVTALLPLEAWSKTHQFNRIARILLDAPAKATEDGAWAGVLGVVADPTPIQWAEGGAAIGRSVETDKAPAISVDATFDIDTGEGLVAVDPAEACWATLVTRSVTVEETSGDAAKQSKSVREEWIPVGASVLAAGRLRRSSGAARMTSTGPESLLLFAAPPGSDARGELLAQLHDRRKVVFVLIVIAAFAAVSALAFMAPLIRR